MTTANTPGDRRRFIDAITRPAPAPRPKPSRWVIYTAAVATATFVWVVAVGLLWLYTGGNPR